MKILFLSLIFSIFTFLYADEERLNELFYFLAEKGIVLEEDIYLEELFEMKENGELYLSNGKLNKDKLNKKFSTLLNKRKKLLKSGEDKDTIFVINEETIDHSKLFYYLERNGVVLEQDVSIDELYNMKEAGLLYLKDGSLNLKELNKKLNIVLKYKEEQFKRLNKQLSHNTEANKVVQQYINDNNSAIQEAQDKIKEQSSEEDSWFVKTINSILEMLKL